ncbi:MAG: uroporphyrinogen-III synthase [Cytophagales bacterium]|nr:uroporphyrinogen-III synthase [Cytophagales bacterium]
MRAIVTRPEPECAAWVSAIQAEGLSAVALPLMDIASRAFAFDAAKNYDAFVCVSRSAVNGFLQSQNIKVLEGKRCLVSGLGTRAALIQQGIQASCIDSPAAASNQFDSEALWTLASQRDWRGKRVLVVRGANAQGEPEGRPWLADQLAAAGASVDFVSTYERRLPVLTDASRAILQSPQADDVWLFSSSQSIAHLKLLAPSTDWRGSRAIATHDRISMTAMDAGFGNVQIVRPVIGDVVAALRSKV